MMNQYVLVLTVYWMHISPIHISPIIVSLSNVSYFFCFSIMHSCAIRLFYFLFFFFSYYKRARVHMQSRRWIWMNLLLVSTYKSNALWGTSSRGQLREIYHGVIMRTRCVNETYRVYENDSRPRSSKRTSERANERPTAIVNYTEKVIVR